MKEGDSALGKELNKGATHSPKPVALVEDIDWFGLMLMNESASFVPAWILKYPEFRCLFPLGGKQLENTFQAIDLRIESNKHGFGGIEPLAINDHPAKAAFD